MAKAKESKPRTPGKGTGPRLLSRPLESLCFLLPLLLFYEIGCWFVRPTTVGSPGQERVVAFYLLRVFFELFGSTGVWMPALAVVIILLCTHLASRRPWELRSRAIGLMYVESLLLAVPLLAFSLMLRASPETAPAEDHVFADVILGIGAGVYEELVFRLVLVSVLVIAGVDLLGWTESWTVPAAVFISALAFAAHHHPPLGSEPFMLDKFVFRAVAGAYLGALFVFRGYGPAAGAHAAYNVLVTLLH